MSSLTLLPTSTIHKIASSQVITSVSTAVKELVENSLDAGADSIEIKLEEYGLGRIEVRDSGCGINTSDVQFMAQRYYTSKITDFENLSKLSSYGFRGEALCSLCSVGNVTITTKTKDNAIAHCYTLGQAGKVRSKRPIPSSTGTTVVITDLFKNLPVRKQFLSSTKKCKEELKKVEETIMAFGSIHPSVRLVLWHNKSIIWQKSKVNSYKTALMSAFGTSVMASMERVDYNDNESNFKICAYFPKPDSDPSITCRTNNDRGFIFVNDRPVVMKEVSQMIRQYYTHAGLRHPFMFLSIKLPPDHVDVNLEPNKTRVLLTEKEKILDALKGLFENLYIVPEAPKQDTPGQLVIKNYPCLNMEARSKCDVNISTSRNTGKNIDSTNISSICNDNNFNPMASSTLNSTIHAGLNDNECLMTDKGQLSSDKNCCPGLLNNVTSTEENLMQSINSQDNGESDPEKIHNFHSRPAKIIPCQARDMCPNVTACPRMPAIAKQNKVNSNLQSKEHVNAVMDKNTFEKLLLDDVPQKSSFDNSGLGKENVGNINQLLATNEVNQEENKQRTSGELAFKDILDNSNEGFDGDIEFDQILKEIADEKTVLSQANQSDKSYAILNGKENSALNIVGTKSWSMGNTITEKQGNPVEPVQLFTSATVKHSSLMKTLSLGNCHSQKTAATRQCHNRTTPLLGKRKLSLKESNKAIGVLSTKRIHRIPQIQNQSLIPFHASQTPKERLKLATKVVASFSLRNLKNAYDTRNIFRTLQSDSTKSVIGWLEPSGMWLMLNQSKIVVVNHCRIQEQILYHKLKETHVLSRQKLDNSVQLNPRIVGGEDCWDVLINLESQIDYITMSKTIVDTRMRSNGFEVRIKQDPDTGEFRVELFCISTLLPFYGVPDLAETLGLIKSKGIHLCSLAECRPLKVLNYLKGEAVRICRAQNFRRSKEGVEELLVQVEECLLDDIKTCLHGQPFFRQIADISKLL